MAIPANVPASDVYCVPVVATADGKNIVIYTLGGTHYGRLFLIFRVGGAFDTFKVYAESSLKPGYKIASLIVLSKTVEGVRDSLMKQDLVPAGASRVSLEGTEFFDQVIAELIADTIWAET